MSSILPILAVAMVLQTETVGAPAAAPTSIDAALTSAAPDDDPIGALMLQSEAAHRDAASAEAAPLVPVVATPPSPAATYVRPPSPVDEDEDAAEARAMLPPGPRPYNALPPTPTVRPNYRLFTNPMVRLRPAPQGSLDGGWVLARPDGRKLYSFQFNDMGGDKEIEGAWRDLDGEWSTLASGPVASVGYQGSGVTIRFVEKGRSDMSVVVLQRSASGDWTGEFQSRNGPTQVVMRRN